VGDRDPYFGRTGVRRGSAMVPLDRALVSSHMASMPLTEAVWPQFAMQLFDGAVSTSVWGNGGRRGSELVPQGSGQAALFTF